MTQQSPHAPRLLDQMREKLRVRHYAWRTEQAYLMWIVKFLKFHRDRNDGRWRHPRQLGKAEIAQFRNPPPGERVRLRTVQELLGHKSLETTMIYTNVMARPGLGVRSPLDV